jgi:hypothetical protein
MGLALIAEGLVLLAGGLVLLAEGLALLAGGLALIAEGLALLAGVLAALAAAVSSIALEQAHARIAVLPAVSLRSSITSPAIERSARLVERDGSRCASV